MTTLDKGIIIVSAVLLTITLIGIYESKTWKELIQDSEEDLFI